MPQLRDWMLHHPSAWTPQQAADYVWDTRVSLLAGIGPTALTVGVAATCGILLQVLYDLVAAQPEHASAVLDHLVRTAERVEQIGEERVLQ